MDYTSLVFGFIVGAGLTYLHYLYSAKWAKKLLPNKCHDEINWFEDKFETFNCESIKFWQRRTRGWDYTELWSLYFHIAKFSLPRLVELRKLYDDPEHYHSQAHPIGVKDHEEWMEILDKIIFSMNYIIEDETSNKWDNEYLYGDKDKYYEAEEKMREGCELFGKHFLSLWD